MQSGVLSRRPVGPSVRSSVRPVLSIQSLEPRRLLAVISWTGGGDNTSWNQPANWSLLRVPADGDDVIIDTFSPSNVRVVGDTALLNSLLNRETLTLTGNIFTISSSVLVNNGSLVNEGTIVFTSGSFPHESSLLPFGNALIHNKPGGVMRFEPSSGGNRKIGGPDGTFLNEGSMIGNTETAIYGPFVNAGSIQMNTSRLWLTQAQSTFAPGSSVIGRVDALAGSINITSTNANFTINTEADVDFLGNLSPDVTINVRGNQFARGATLRVPGEGTINKGTIQLTSIEGGYASSMLGTGGLINDGTVRTITGTGGGRTIDLDGAFDGTGAVELNQPFTFFRVDRVRQNTVFADRAQIILNDDPTNAGTSKAKFTLDVNTRFEINRNAVIFDYEGATVINDVAALLLTGYSGDGWNNSTGINSYAINETGDTIGYSEATAAGVANDTFAGVSVDATAILVRQTKTGDVNLDRAVNFSDLLTLAQNYGTTTGARWSNGDFFYDGNIDFGDLLALAQQYGYTGLRSGTSAVKQPVALSVAPTVLPTTAPKPAFRRFR
jgi:hypothetical protein